LCLKGEVELVSNVSLPVVAVDVTETVGAALRAEPSLWPAVFPAVAPGPSETHVLLAGPGLADGCMLVMYWSMRFLHMQFAVEVSALVHAAVKHLVSDNNAMQLAVYIKQS
jgi:negative regulator of sigma E activity